MNTIVQVVTNVRHNGTDYSKGTVMELDPSMQALVVDGLFREIKGAKSVEDGMRIVGQEVTTTAEEKEEVVASGDTWGAQPDPKTPEAPKAPETEETKEPAAPAEGDKTPAGDTTTPAAPVTEGQAPAADAVKDDGITGKDL